VSFVVKHSQRLPRSQAVRSASRATKSVASPLMGRLFDERGVGLAPSHAVKGARRYRYYVSRGLIKGTADRSPSSLDRAKTSRGNRIVPLKFDHFRTILAEHFGDSILSCVGRGWNRFTCRQGLWPRLAPKPAKGGLLQCNRALFRRLEEGVPRDKGTSAGMKHRDEFEFASN
jgi:hypothetical protein